MSTIASPRDPSTPIRRVPSAGIHTPTSSTRASLDADRSAVNSPVNNSRNSSHGPPPPPTTTGGAGGGKRANRAALREYYKLRAAAPRIGIELPDSEVPVSDMDSPDFDARAYVARVTAESGLEELLRLYTRVVGEVRALDAEKKALVYDNYSKLIDATETIRKMRSNMDPLNPVASTLNPAMAQIYAQAAEIRAALRESIPAPGSDEARRRAAAQHRKRTRELAMLVLATPARLRLLVKEGKLDEAAAQWERPRRLLQTWKEKGLGGDQVQACIDEGDAALGLGAERGVSARASKDGRESTL